MSKGGGDVTIGYKYFLGIHFVLCHGDLDAMTHITVDDRIAWSGSSSGGAIQINNADLFGGEKREGGIAGTVDFLTGSATQGQNYYLTTKLGQVVVPAYSPPSDGSSISYSLNGYISTSVVGGVKTVVNFTPNKTITTVTQTDGSTVTTTVTTNLQGQQTTEQTSTGPIVAVVASEVPAYRRVASAILNQVYLGTNPYLKKWAFRVRRILKRSDGSPQWYVAKAAIGQDMNPAHIIYECLTDNDWGMGYSPGDLSEADFIAAADTLYSESFGLSIIWEKEAEIEAFIKSILKHIDAALYVDKATGKFVLKLIRADYVTANLKSLDESNVIKIEDYTCSTFTELVNTVTLNFWNASVGRTDSMTVQDIAMVQVQGGTITQTVEYGGITNASLASRVASRDLKALSTPMISCTVYVNRIGGLVKPGEAVRLSWPDYGVTDLVMRVGMIEFGTQTDNTIKLKLVQDVFSLGTATYAPPAQTEWVSPVSAPQPAVNRFTIEAPYYVLARAVGDTEINSRLSSLPEAGFVMTGAAAPGSGYIGGDVWLNDGSGYTAGFPFDYCPYGVLSEGVSPMSTLLEFVTSQDMISTLVSVGDYALIDNEIVRIDAFNSVSARVSRGMLDTVPATHASGAKLFVCSRFRGLGSNEFVSGEAISVKLLTRTGRGTLPIGSAPVSSLTMGARAIRPYPPGNWTICNSYFPVSVVDTPLTTSWASRNRLTQTGSTMITFATGNISSEAGVTYSLRLYNADTNTLLHSQDGITTTSYSSFPSMTGKYNLRLELWSVRGSYASYQKHSHTFYYENISRLTIEAGTDHLLTEDDNTLITE